MSQLAPTVQPSEDTVAVLSESSSSVSLASPTTTKRRGSLPASAAEVITTDQIRPDWKVKLATARARSARRSAAATALHASAFLSMDSGGSSSRSSRDRSSRTRTSRFGRLGSSQSKLSLLASKASSSLSNGDVGSSATTSTITTATSTGTAQVSPQLALNENGVSSEESVSRVPKSMVDIVGGRLQELEDMMFLEAVRLSMQEEEERKNKEQPNGNSGDSRGSSLENSPVHNI